MPPQQKEQQPSQHDPIPPWLKWAVYAVQKVGFGGIVGLVILYILISHAPTFSEGYLLNMKAQADALKTLEDSILTIHSAMDRVERSTELSIVNKATLESLESRFESLEDRVDRLADEGQE